jgi:tellurium resistance protein TerZ
MPVSLVKGQKISLQKEAGGTLTSVRMGLGWDVARPAGVLGRMFAGEPDAIDLDASCGLFDTQGNLLDLVWFRQLASHDGSIRHTGDNLTGAGEGDDESIIVDLARVPAGVTSLVFTVNSYRGQSFDRVENAFCRLLDHGTGSEIARYDLSARGGHTAMVMARLYRRADEWKMHAIGEAAAGRTFQEILPAIEPHL